MSGEERDLVDEILDQWKRECPDLDCKPMAVFGRLNRLDRVSNAAIEARLGEHGLSRGEFDVLATLRRGGEPYTLAPTALARWMMLSSAAMTNRVDRLEAAGLVERRPDPGDRRGVLVALTPDGKRVVDAAVADHVENERRLLEPLTAEEQQTLNALLRKLLLGLRSG
ncbi:MAG: MarR family winged helix-turn-helix transcriptional regulator [Rubrobacteraceae bacterium]|jgi:DNA-binding MarR family transcriptional regulator